MFPEELPYRIIRMFSFIGDIVLDPFSGSSTTGVAAYKEERQYIGMELEEEYLKTSIKRLRDEFDTVKYGKEKRSNICSL